MSAGEFTREVASMRPVLEGFSRHFTYDRDAALDLVQDTILKALTYRARYQSGTNLRGWLYTIMRNIFINNYRRSKRIRFSSDPVTEFKLLGLADNHTFSRPADTAEFNELWTSINNLRDDIGKPFKMYLTGYKYQEIAEALAIPIGTVKNRIFHARQEMQQQMAR
jgi:RNA polymerase sigma-70 factor (ECF subfamily)